MSAIVCSVPCQQERTFPIKVRSSLPLFASAVVRASGLGDGGGGCVIASLHESREANRPCRTARQTPNNPAPSTRNLSLEPSPVAACQRGKQISEAEYSADWCGSN